MMAICFIFRVFVIKIAKKVIVDGSTYRKIEVRFLVDMVVVKY